MPVPLCTIFLKKIGTRRAKRLWRRKRKVQAVCYVRTSSATNVGGDKDKRQRASIARFAKSKGFDLVGEVDDPAVSGADPIETRPGFTALLDRIEGNGVRVVLVEDASRFARDLVAQELGVLMLIKRGVRVLTAAGDDLTDTSDPTRIMMRQIAGAFAEYEKRRLVAKLNAARDRKAGGRPPVLWPVRVRPGSTIGPCCGPATTGGGPVLRAISAAMADRGHATSGGKPYRPTSIAAMVSGKR